MNDIATHVVGRLAPSPTGGLHVGHARTFLIAWLSARSAGGRVILRVEDIDTSRVRPGMTDAAIADLRWLGLDWDEGPDVGGPHGPYLQSLRLELHTAALGRLKTLEVAYPCTCTRADIGRLASAPHAEDEEPAYPGTCAIRRVRDAEALSLAGRRFAWRFRVLRRSIERLDLMRGPIALDPGRHGGDFLVGRSTGEPAYQLAVVVDDAAMGITQVVRGNDLVTSTPRQILLYEALGESVPHFGHVPLVADETGRRLAKRDRSIKLAALRESGVDPARLLGWLAASCGWVEAGVRIRPLDLVGRNDVFDLPEHAFVARVEDLKRSLL